MDTDPRRSIARLAAAVMAADARVTTSELAAVGALVRLGLGSLEAPTREELAHAAHAPLDVEPACAALAAAYPEAGGTILAALADIALSDGDLDPREVAILGRIGDALGVPPAVVAHLVRAAAAEAGVALPTGEAPPPSPAGPPASPPPAEAATAVSEPASGQLVPAYALLGLEPGAPPAAVEQAYRAALERYQPLKVLDLGPEFAVLAVRRLTAATAAYTAIVGAVDAA